MRIGRSGICIESSLVRTDNSRNDEMVLLHGILDIADIIIRCFCRFRDHLRCFIRFHDKRFNGRGVRISACGLIVREIFVVFFARRKVRMRDIALILQYFFVLQTVISDYLVRVPIGIKL